MKTTFGDVFGARLRALVPQVVPVPVAGLLPVATPPVRYDEAQLVGEVLEWLQRRGFLAVVTGLQQQFFEHRDAL